MTRVMILVLAALFAFDFADVTFAQCEGGSCDASSRPLRGLRERIQERRGDRGGEGGGGMAQQTLANFLAPKPTVEQPTQVQEDRFDMLFARQAEQNRLAEQRRREDADRAEREAMQAEFDAKLAELARPPVEVEKQPATRTDPKAILGVVLAAATAFFGVIKP